MGGREIKTDRRRPIRYAQIQMPRKCKKSGVGAAWLLVVWCCADASSQQCTVVRCTFINDLTRKVRCALAYSLLEKRAGSERE